METQLLHDTNVLWFRVKYSVKTDLHGLRVQPKQSNLVWKQPQTPAKTFLLTNSTGTVWPLQGQIIIASNRISIHQWKIWNYIHFYFIISTWLVLIEQVCFGTVDGESGCRNEGMRMGKDRRWVIMQSEGGWERREGEGGKRGVEEPSRGSGDMSEVSLSRDDLTAMWSQAARSWK